MTTHDTSGGAVVLSHLSKSYGDVRAVRSIDLTIVPGETVALLGPNGAGKSTTIDMVLGLTRPDSGSVSLFGMSPAEAAAAGVVGGMLQTGSLVDYLSVRELVTMVASLYPSARCRGCAGAQRVLGVRPPPDQEAVRGPGLTPLTAAEHLGARVACGFVMALLVIALVSLSGTALGVSLSAGQWTGMIGLMLVGLVPLTVLGILLGHVVTPDSLAPAVGGTIMLLALLGGAYGFLVAKSGALFDVIKALPSYWIVQAGKTAVDGGGWPVEAWIVIAGWTAVLVPLAVLVYRRDTGRV